MLWALKYSTLSNNDFGRLKPRQQQPTLGFLVVTFFFDLPPSFIYLIVILIEEDEEEEVVWR